VAAIRRLQVQHSFVEINGQCFFAEIIELVPPIEFQYDRRDCKAAHNADEQVISRVTSAIGMMTIEVCQTIRPQRCSYRE